MNTQKLRHLFVGVLFGGLVLLAASKSSLPLDHWQNVDPRVFVEQSLAVARSGELLLTRDPPLRYIPLAILFRILSPSWDTAVQIAVTYAALGSYVFIPASVFVFFRTVVSRDAGYIAILAWVLARTILFSPSFALGSWQYDLSAPVVFLTLVACHQAVSAASPSKQTRWEFVTAFGLGVLGLHQWTMAAFAILVVTIVYARHRALRGIAISAVVGGLMAVTLFFLPDEGHLRSGLPNRVLPESGAVVSIDSATAAITSPGVVVMLALGVFLAVAWHRDQLPEADVLTVSILVFYLVKIPFSFTDLSYLGWVAQRTFYPLVVGLAAYLAVSLIVKGVKTQTPVSVFGYNSR